MPVFNVRSDRTGKVVATMLDRDLASAVANTRNQARLFNRDPDDLMVKLDSNPAPNAERERFGFAWLDRGEGEGKRSVVINARQWAATCERHG